MKIFFGSKVADLTKAFKDIYKKNPFGVVCAPGRVNLIGEHTDYNEGFVLPMPIDRNILMAASPRKDYKLNFYSVNYRKKFKTTLDRLVYSKSCKWANYIQGVIKVLLDKGISLKGIDLAFSGDIPIGSGLSSSAALEVAAIIMLKALNGFKMSKTDMALACQKAENEFVGVNCGIMDQYVSLIGKRGHALFLDCRSLKYRHVPLNLKNHVFVITDSRCERKLSASEYNKRRKECEEGLEIFKKYKPGIKSIRDISMKDFLKHKNKLSKIQAKRIEHVITENQRVLDSVRALKNGNLKLFGRLMNESHISLRDNYEVSSKELNLLVDTALEINGVLGSRLTGAGFGGCTVSLVHKDNLNVFTGKIVWIYQREFNKKPYFYISKAEGGAGFSRI